MKLYNVKALAVKIKMTHRKTITFCKVMHFDTVKIHYGFARSLISIPDNHPIIKSIKLTKGRLRPFYTILQLLTMWKWKAGSGFNYRRGLMRKLHNYDIPIYNGGNKGYVFLSDLQYILNNKDFVDTTDLNEYKPGDSLKNYRLKQIKLKSQNKDKK